MDKQFKKWLLIFLGISIILPIMFNFGIIYINSIPSAGNNGEMLNFYGSYCGGVLGGLATLITIYFTFIKDRNEHKPLLYFNNNRFYFYHGLVSFEHKFSKKFITSDNEMMNDNLVSVIFDLENVGKYPALDVQIEIVNSKDFLESIKKLNPSQETLNNVDKSYSKDKEIYGTRSLLKSEDSAEVVVPTIFEHLLNELIYVYNKNIKDNKDCDNNYAIHGRFKLFDILVKYHDIDSTDYNIDTFTVYIRIDSVIQSATTLKECEPWFVTIEFEKM